MTSESVVALMWEARVASGRLDEVVNYLRERSWPVLVAYDGFLSGELYRADGGLSGDARAVVITRWRDQAALSNADDGAAALAGVPYLARPPHSWQFQPVATGEGDPA